MRLARRSGTLRGLLASTILALGAAAPAAAGPIAGTPPYPQSPYITSVTFEWPTYTLHAPGSDNWPITEAADGTLYTTWGDGGGFGENASRLAYVGIGIASLSGGSAKTITGTNLIGGLDYKNAKCFPAVPPAKPEKKRKTTNFQPCIGVGLPGKSRGILALGSDLHLFITPNASVTGYKEARLYKGDVRTNKWTRAAWALTNTDPNALIIPSFVQAGPGNADLDHVYV
jgi:hypothetical protein